MRVLIADRFSDEARATLTAEGFTIIYTPDERDDALKQAIADSEADVLVVRSTQVTADMLRAGHLSLVIRAGAGYNTIDVATAKANGIFVSNCPGKNSNAVAEIAFGMIIDLDRQITANTADLRNGIWRKAHYSNARGLAGSALGLVGVGRIGRAMIPRAKAFGMRVIGWSRSHHRRHCYRTGDRTNAIALGSREIRGRGERSCISDRGHTSICQSHIL